MGTMDGSVIFNAENSLMGIKAWMSKHNNFRILMSHHVQTTNIWNKIKVKNLNYLQTYPR